MHMTLKIPSFWKIMDSKLYNGGIEKIEETEYLVPPGENFGGEVRKLEITVKDEKAGSEEKLHAVAKQIPDNEFAREIFNIQQTFKGEINFYDKLLPTLRISNGGMEFRGEVVDENAVIVLENLTVSGFRNLDRYIGYDFDQARVLLKDLATLHAVPLAMKLKEPDLFENNVRKLCVNKINSIDHDEIFVTMMLDLLWESDKCSPFICKVKKILETPKIKIKTVREPFATFAHDDMWVNNAMMKLVNGRPIANKFVDFQVYKYASPASDLLFFLFTSVQQQVLEEDLDTLIKFYHTEFLKNLHDLGCDTTPFRMEHFEKELALESKGVFAVVVMFISFIIFGEKGKKADFSGEPPDVDNIPFRDEMRKNIHPKAKEKIWFTVQAFGKRGWL
ncbi:hypothetical protein JTB14_001385 [Gonioctena quinquepunctata]|nr:hypothetical protein JTB14_001385 [Gonioctena quinquepunctata]